MTNKKVILAYSIDQSFWGYNNECGILEDSCATSPEDTPDTLDAPKVMKLWGLHTEIYNTAQSKENSQ